MPSVLDLMDRPHRGRTKPYRRTHPLDRIAGLVDITDEGCWRWLGRLSNAGYGQMTFSQAGYPAVTTSAHRASFELHNGPIPQGLVIDHLCRDRTCVNPSHMEAVRQRENVMRSPIAPGALNAAKTHCAQGHPYSPENTYVFRSKTRSFTGRQCRACTRAYAHRRYLKLTGAIS